MTAMAHRLKTCSGGADYALRKQGRRAGVRRHRTRDEIARAEAHWPRVESGRPRLEPQAHERVEKGLMRRNGHARARKLQASTANSVSSTPFVMQRRSARREMAISRQKKI